MALVGRGVLQGLGVTLKTFFQTYPWGRVLLRLFGIKPTEGVVTIEYPDVKQQHAERFRVFPFLVYDRTPDDLRCVSCKICEQECPPQCIHIAGPAKDAQGRPLKAHGRTYPVAFVIDTSICMSCRICVDVCPFDAIEMDSAYELSAHDRFGKDMIYDKNKLLKSDDYFHQIKPTEAAEVDARLAAKATKPAPAVAKGGPGAEAPPPKPPAAGQIPPTA